ncbi:MAG: TatD family hydrolase [Mongoliitalea sp.]
MKFIDFHTHQPPQSNRLYNLPNLDPVTSPFSIGIHPWYLNENWPENLETVEPHLKLPQVYALGEIGFDGIKGPSENMQQAAFQAQADLAKAYELPIILHCVKGLHLLQAYLKKNPDTVPIIWHGWNLKPSIAQSLMNYPVFFSFGKQLMYAGSNAEAWLRACPVEKIFFETDDSDLPIEAIYQQASVILGRSLEELAVLAASNWKSISKKHWYE